jgi:hypothetical protein
LSKFMPKLAMTLNRDFAGGRNETTVLLINQVRAKEKTHTMPGRIVQEKDKYQPASGAWALKHGKAIELQIHNGKRLYDENIEAYIGRVKTWEIAKGKLGTHEGKKGEFTYFYESGVDLVDDLVSTCLRLGVITGTGWYVYDGDEEWAFRAQGLPRVRQHVQENQALYDKLRQECLEKSQVIYRYR